MTHSTENKICRSCETVAHCSKAGCIPLQTEHPAPAPSEDASDAKRYRWLRDKSEPGICAFYLSVGDAFKGVKFARETVDEAIDAQIAAQTNTEGAQP